MSIDQDAPSNSNVLSFPDFFHFLREELAEQVQVSDTGKIHTINKGRLLAKHLVLAACNGDKDARDLIFKTLGYVG